MYSLHQRMCAGDQPDRDTLTQRQRYAQIWKHELVLVHMLPVESAVEESINPSPPLRPLTETLDPVWDAPDPGW